MNILIDTNIVISLEPTAPEHAEPRTATAASLFRVASEGGHRLLLHPESLRELAHDTDQRRRDLREILLRKYERLDPAPPMADEVVTVCGSANPASHDFVDHLMLSAVVANDLRFALHLNGTFRPKSADGTLRWLMGALTADEKAQICTTGDLTWTADQTGGSIMPSGTGVADPEMGNDFAQLASLTAERSRR